MIYTKEILKNFTKAELIGREKVKTLLDNSSVNYKFTEGRYDPYDIITSRDNNTSGLTEVKYREKYASTNNTIKTEGTLLERKKYDGIMREYRSNPHYNKALYITIFNDNWMYCWDLLSLHNPKWEWKELVYETKGDTRIVKKEVTYVKLNDAIKFRKL